MDATFLSHSRGVCVLNLAKPKVNTHTSAFISCVQWVLPGDVIDWIYFYVEVFPMDDF